jgi:hypothetical protein
VRFGVEVFMRSFLAEFFAVRVVEPLAELSWRFGWRGLFVRLRLFSRWLTDDVPF